MIVHAPRDLRQRVVGFGRNFARHSLTICEKLFPWIFLLKVAINGRRSAYTNIMVFRISGGCVRCCQLLGGRPLSRLTTAVFTSDGESLPRIVFLEITANGRRFTVLRWTLGVYSNEFLWNLRLSAIQPQISLAISMREKITWITYDIASRDSIVYDSLHWLWYRNMSFRSHLALETSG